MQSLQDQVKKMTMDSPESIEYWGTLITDKKSSPMMRRLIISISDHLRATITSPGTVVAAQNGKSYHDSKQMFKLFELMDVKEGRAAEQQLMRYQKGPDRGSMYFSFLLCLGIIPEKFKKGSAPEFSLVSREHLRKWIILSAVADPDLTHRRINTLLATKDHTFLDPFTDAAWEHPQIPRSAYPNKGNAALAKRFVEDLEKWKKYVADAKGKEVEPQRTQASSPLSQQSQRAVASAELNAARMRAQAVANANTEWRVNPKTHQSHSYTPGNF